MHMDEPRFHLVLHRSQSRWRNFSCLATAYKLRAKLLVCMPSPNVGGVLSVLQVLNMDYGPYGVSVLGSPLSIMKVP